jgi:hypothetical protein
VRTCETLQTCPNGGILQYCSTYEDGACEEVEYVVAGASFACASCSDCGSASQGAKKSCTGGFPSPPADASVSPPDAGELACPPLTNLDGFTPTYKPPAAHQNACSQANIDNFRDFCLGTGNQAACQSFLATAAGKTCANCILTPATAATLGPLIDHTAQGYVTVNTAGCIALEQGNDTCAKATDALSQCDDAACVNCKITDDASLAAFNECTSLAETQVCASYVAPAACANALVDAGVCPSANSGDFTSQYNAVVPIFCLTH